MWQTQYHLQQARHYYINLSRCYTTKKKFCRNFQIPAILTPTSQNHTSKISRRVLFDRSTPKASQANRNIQTLARHTFTLNQSGPLREKAAARTFSDAAS